MIITKDVIDMLGLEHVVGGECSDEDINAGEIGMGVCKKNGVVIERGWDKPPRCIRCYMIAHIGMDIDEALGNR